MVADLGFRPGPNGFSFPNYGSGAGAVDLTPVEMQRMFGDSVCSGEGEAPEGGCILTPTAQLWMENTNNDMGGGHCEGMATLSLLFYTGLANPGEYGGGSASDLAFGNDVIVLL